MGDDLKVTWFIETDMVSQGRTPEELRQVLDSMAVKSVNSVFSGETRAFSAMSGGHSARVTGSVESEARGSD